MLSGFEDFTRKVVLEILPQDERAFVRVVVASCDKHKRDGQFSRSGRSRKMDVTLTPDVTDPFEYDSDLLDGFSSRERQEDCTSQDRILSLYGIEVRAAVSTVIPSRTYWIVALDWV